MTKSMTLLYEALSELQELADEAQSRNSLIYEGMGYTPYQVVLLEAEEDEGAGGEKKDSFLKRAAGAVKKLTKAAEGAVEEMESLRDKMQEYGFGATVDALNRAIKDLKKKTPTKGFLGKIGTGAGMAVRALFGKEDDPAEAVAEIVTDANTFQKIFGGVVKAVFDQLEKIEVAKVVDETTGEEQELSDDEKKEYVEQLKAKMKDATLNDMINSPDWEEFREGSGFGEATIKDAVAGALKPAEGMFSGLRSLGSSLGIGLGGDVPFKKYYGMDSGRALMDDIMLLTPSQLQSFMKSGGGKSSDTDMENVGAGLKGLAAAKEEAPKEAGGGGDAAGTTTGGGTSTGAAGSSPSGGGGPVDKVLTAAGITDPAGAREKFADLMGIQLGEVTNFSLYDLLQEKVVRYPAVVDALKGHIPEDEGPQAIAITKLADEMKAEFGTEYDIVGIPDTGKQEREALRAEIQALRDALEGLPPEERDAAAQRVADQLQQQGVDSETATAAVTADTSVDDVVLAAEEEEIPALTSDMTDIINADETTEPAQETSDETPVAPEEKKSKTKRDAGTYWEVSPEALAKDKKKRPYAAKGKGPKSKKQQRFKTEKAAKAHSLKTEIAKHATGLMRRYLLETTQDFRYVSGLSHHQIISEFYSRGGTNVIVKKGLESQLQKNATTSRW